MSGFGLVAMVLLTSMVVVQLMVFTVFSFESLLLEQAEGLKHVARNSYEARVLSVEAEDVLVALTNNGPSDVRVKNLLSSDLFLIYFDTNSNKKVKYVEYLATTPPSWRINEVRFGDFQGELLDPIDLGSGLEGVWNVGETLIAVVVIDEQVNQLMPVIVKFEVVA
ncbi:MAG: hypothetical protein QXX49_02600 [Candidatus Caldarchaeum sp.]|uniref:Uncharacterized protein n=1 Tax=Caldiarchaeum subterraneum TaxID=311458 RepID=A0A7J3VSJ7_CALS0